MLRSLILHKKLMLIVLAVINGDIKRVYGHLSHQWVMYMQHLEQDYPYLFSLAVRLNPMIDSPDPHVY